MPSSKTAGYKDPLWITAGLDAALNMEKEKYIKCPVKPDLVSDHVTAQGWGYVVAGYSLVEMSFKALLNIRNKKVPRTHSLSNLFKRFDRGDKKILREFYLDYKATIGGSIGNFPFETLDDFLCNLDGDKNESGDYVGSLVWRYSPIEEQQNKKMPLVCVDYLHEIVYGCIRMVEYSSTNRFEPSQYTYSWRMYRKREIKYQHWLDIRMISEGWDDLGDRLEILWGPDYRGRYDLYLFRGKGLDDFFSEIPDDIGLPIVDKRKEIETFDVEV